MPLNVPASVLYDQQSYGNRLSGIPGRVFTGIPHWAAKTPFSMISLRASCEVGFELADVLAAFGALARTFHNLVLWPDSRTIPILAYRTGFIASVGFVCSMPFGAGDLNWSMCHIFLFN